LRAWTCDAAGVYTLPRNEIRMYHLILLESLAIAAVGDSHRDTYPHSLFLVFTLLPRVLRLLDSYYF
jgi:hypothetical protein